MDVPAPRILIIDDDDDCRSLLRDLLKKEQYDVQEAENGRKGLSCFKDRPADLVITDIFMPDCDGLEVIREIKMVSPQSKIIAISSGAGLIADMLPVAKAFGADCTLARSTEFSRLITAVKAVLAEEKQG